MHRLETALLEDLSPDSDARALGAAGAKKRWQKQTPAERAKQKQLDLDNAFETSTLDGKVTIYSMAQYLDVTPKTLKARLRKDGRFWCEGEEVGRKEPGYKG